VLPTSSEELLEILDLFLSSFHGTSASDKFWGATWTSRPFFFSSFHGILSLCAILGSPVVTFSVFYIRIEIQEQIFRTVAFNFIDWAFFSDLACTQRSRNILYLIWQKLCQFWSYFDSLQYPLIKTYHLQESKLAPILYLIWHRNCVNFHPILIFSNMFLSKHITHKNPSSFSF